MRQILVLLLVWSVSTLRGQFWVEHERVTTGSMVHAAELTPTGERVYMGTLLGSMDFGGTVLEYNSSGGALYVALQEANGTWRWARKFESSWITGTSLDLAPTGEVVVAVTAAPDAIYSTMDLAEPTTAARILHLAPADGEVTGYFSLPCEEASVRVCVLSDGVLALTAKLDQFSGHIMAADGTLFDTPSECVLLLMEADGGHVLTASASGEAYPQLYVMDNYANGDLLLQLTYNDGPCTFLGETYEELGLAGGFRDDFILLRITRSGDTVWNFGTTGSSEALQHGSLATLTAAGTFDWLVWATGAVEFGDLTINGSARITIDGHGQVVASQELDMNECMMHQSVPLPAGDALVMGRTSGWDSALGSFVQTEGMETPFIAHLTADGVWDQVHFFQTYNVCDVSLLSVRGGQCLLAGYYEYSLELNGVEFPDAPLGGGVALLLGEACMAAVLDSVTAATCDALNGGGIAMHVNGGMEPHTWAWTDGANTAVRTGLAAGTYQATVTDADGCSVSAAAYVPGPSAGTGGDLFGMFTPWPYFRPGVETTTLAFMHTFACDPPDATMRVVLDPMTYCTGGLTGGDQQIGDTLVLAMGQPGPGEQALRTLTLNTLPAAQAGDTVCFQITLLPFEGDPDPGNNEFEMCYPVVNSYDPNDKHVTPAGIAEEGYIDTHVEKLDYLIRFQNTGNAPAFNVFIDDTLDVDLDISGLELMGSSHAMQLEVRDGRTLRFRFDDINLPDSTNDEANSHGYVAYRIPIRANAPLGTVIRNTAHIFFDLNPAVVTNTTVNTIGLPVGIGDRVNIVPTIVLVPNPVRDVLTFRSASLFAGEMVRVFDQQGREVVRTTVQGERTTLDVGALVNGVYLLRVGEGAVRFVKVE